MNFILPHIQRLKPYASGAQPPGGSNVIKLNLNENPYPPSQNVLNVLRTIDEEALRLYPDARCDELREALAQQYGVDKKHTFCGNGSSEIISIIFTVFVESYSRIAIPDPSFSLYHSIASIHQVECVRIPTREDFSVDVDMLVESGAQVIVLVNPNAPTGRLLPFSDVERLVQNFPGLVIVDEAYIDFAESSLSAIPLIECYENLVVVRTFSKAYSLCGARVGYCFSNEKLINALEKGKGLYNVNIISQKLALAALQDQEYMKNTTAAVRRTRGAFSADLRRLGFDVIPSQTNFILCTPPPQMGENGAQELYEKLMERNIYVRYFKDTRLYDKLRISIGTKEEMDTLYNELHSLLVK
ncbi:histidinol-phosphate transaminase [Metabacillus malikii]|uniref:Histidinol-phosphate aminotransferase n=1 Tax=Metabacillus malikii TaxID=1504265 RepID=A0ABT9ZA94_9BACI|nr:histidinol-phosphate transaminase [Metabacillus malikii]MDQ0229164.1 histidinol-phosphate aminotransferase [Metabacillus malikii]